MRYVNLNHFLDNLNEAGLIERDAVAGVWKPRKDIVIFLDLNAGEVIQNAWVLEIYDDATGTLGNRGKIKCSYEGGNQRMQLIDVLVSQILEMRSANLEGRQRHVQNEAA